MNFGTKTHEDYFNTKTNIFVNFGLVQKSEFETNSIILYLEAYEIFEGDT